MCIRDSLRISSMKETILDVLMFMFQSYVEDNEEVELDKESYIKISRRQVLLTKILKELLNG